MKNLKDLGFITGVALAIATPFAIWFALAFGILFLKLSLLTSVVKVVANDCGDEYSVPIVSQDWFCPEKEE